MNGTLIPNTPFAVDFWQIRKCSHVRFFFLSHLHSDHTSGLSSTWCRPIYCSPVTAKLLRWKFQVDEIWIHPLELGDSHLLNLDEVRKETMTVTLIDSNHCPGSVMFLFEGYFGTVLYTADFRYTPMMFTYPPLNTERRIDLLYLDNTNCDPEFMVPSREEATDAIKAIISAHPEHNVVIGLYNLGKESLLIELAMTFKTWIVVSPRRLQMFQLLGLCDVFTSEVGAGRIHVVDQNEINRFNMVKWNQKCPTIAIIPTSRKIRVWHRDVHVIPYSDHSSFQELQEFVARLKPCTIIPVVKTKACEAYFCQYLSPVDDLKQIHVPETVKEFMQKKAKCNKMLLHSHTRLRSLIIPKGVIFESPEKVQHDDSGIDCLCTEIPSSESNKEALQNNDKVLVPSKHVWQDRTEDSNPSVVGKTTNIKDKLCEENINKTQVPLKQKIRVSLFKEQKSNVPLFRVPVRSRQTSLLNWCQDGKSARHCLAKQPNSSSSPTLQQSHRLSLLNASTSLTANGQSSSYASVGQDNGEQQKFEQTVSASISNAGKTWKSEQSFTGENCETPVQSWCYASLQSFDDIVEQYFKKRSKTLMRNTVG
ncbi:5' exonuclease Apollo isoform X1 [Stegostoma tigrinum]|uniref:5' exonuclease Apollo isoform X1 n=2 Tax=Stegostoma tigrinum TaxID=3053191 RepID=UPI00202B3DD6|nr:5' exonuclease Apollo isoform X1 [Stegostoma tigrinum]XP_048409462.1 5' exonuclease Apollo isoform X1 [Stegostoma tigrinum]XP_048409463.1 5' exonuclease Apollo isoform X1 [Stegostoma tigrinum]XP_048409464.1 5' exonuclease Apollo isoform X1 [Stegostoma tigrinum]